MAVRQIEARAVISAQDRTGNVFRAIGDRIRALGRLASGTEARVGSAAQARGALSMASRNRAEAMAAARGGLSGMVAPLGLGSGAMTVGGLALGAGASVKAFASAEREFTRIGAIVDGSREQMRDMMRDAQKLAIETALPFGEIAKGASALASQGRSLEEVKQFLPAVARSAQAAGAEVEDMAKTADAVGTHLRVPAEQMQLAFDTMHQSGKQGQFELKDLARYLPSLLPTAKALGIEGVEGLRNMTSMLQVLRQGSGSAEEAATGMRNIFQKIYTDTTQKKFSEEGVDVEKALAKAKKEGKNLLQVFEDLTRQAIKGDLSKITKLFPDQEASRAMMALLTQPGKWQRLAAENLRTAPGASMRDLKDVTEDTQASIDRMGQSLGNLARQTGALIAPAAVPAMDALAAAAERLRDALDAIEKHHKKANEGFTPDEKTKKIVGGMNSVLGGSSPAEVLKNFLDAKDSDEDVADRRLKELGETKRNLQKARYRDTTSPSRNYPATQARAADLGRQIETIEQQERTLGRSLWMVRSMQAQIAAHTAMVRGHADAANKESGPITGASGYRGAAFGFGKTGHGLSYDGNVVGAGGYAIMPTPPSRPAELTASSDDRIKAAISGAQVTAQFSGTAEGTISGSTQHTINLTLDASGLVNKVETLE